MAEIFKESFIFGTFEPLIGSDFSFAESDPVNVTNSLPQIVENAKNTELVASMLWNMRVVSFICNFWTIVLSAIVIFKLGREIWTAKKQREKKRRMLYFTSIVLVS